MTLTLKEWIWLTSFVSSIILLIWMGVLVAREVFWSIHVPDYSLALICCFIALRIIVRVTDEPVA